MRVCLDATSLLGPRSGVGHATASLVSALVEADADLELVLLPLSLRGGRRLAGFAPRHERVTVLRTPIPGRIASWAWTRGEWPPVELFCGRVDVFHGTNFVLPAVLKGAGVVTVHDVGFVHMPQAYSVRSRSFADALEVWTSRAHRVVVPSEFTRDELSALLPEVSERIRVVPHGVREVFGARGGRLNQPRLDALGLRGPYALYAGNLEARKNLGVLLDAFSAVVGKHPDAQLVLAGAPGVGWDALASEHAQTLGSGSVVVTGYLPDAELAALTRGTFAFVYPSAYEGFGMPPLEAMAAGVPVVASDIAVLREVLGSHATFVGVGDHGGLAAVIADLLDAPPDPVAREAARDWASRYTWAASARATLDVYREALEG